MIEETKKETRGRKPKIKPHYVSPKEFTNAILKYYDDDIMTNYLCESICKIAEGIAHAPNFIKYSYRDDMVSDAKLKMYKALIEKKYKHREQIDDPVLVQEHKNETKIKNDKIIAKKYALIEKLYQGDDKKIEEEKRNVDDKYTLKNAKDTFIRERSPFAYFSSVADHSMIAYIKKEKKNQLAIDNYKDSYYDELINNNIKTNITNE